MLFRSDSGQAEFDEFVRSRAQALSRTAYLRYFEDLTEAQTAEMLGLHVGTVKSSGRKALDRLRVLAPHLEELIND